MTGKTLNNKGNFNTGVNTQGTLNERRSTTEEPGANAKKTKNK